MWQVELIGPPMGLAGMMGGGGGGMGHMEVDMYSGGGGGYPRGRSAGPPLANPSVFNMPPVNNNSFGLAMSGTRTWYMVIVKYDHTVGRRLKIAFFLTIYSSVADPG
jgi:hypothetical protein